MANMKPGFITGANAKIKMFGNTIAYCADVAYNITVQTIPVESMGKYEVHSNEPVGYSVDGSFSIIRYTKRASSGTDGGKIADVASGKGNSPSEILNATGGDAMMHLNPAKLLQSQTFDLEIFEKNATGETSVFKVQDCRLTRRGMTLNKRGVMVDNYAYVGILGTDTDVPTASQTGHSGSTDLS
jgi:hypothetical protein